MINFKITSIVSIAFLLWPTSHKAQTFTGGLTAGFTSTSISIIDHLEKDYTASGKSIRGIEAGVFGRLNFNPFFVKSMLLLTYQVGNIDFLNNDGSVQTSKFNYGKIAIPLLLGFKIIGPIRVEAGTVYNWIYTTKYYNENKISPSGFGYRAGLNIEFGKLNIGFAYQGLTNKSSDYSTASIKTPNELIFSLGLRLGSN